MTITKRGEYRLVGAAASAIATSTAPGVAARGSWLVRRDQPPYFFTPFVIAHTTYLRSAAALSLFVGRMM